jgi:hypothetical protein
LITAASGQISPNTTASRIDAASGPSMITPASNPAVPMPTPAATAVRRSQWGTRISPGSLIITEKTTCYLNDLPPRSVPVQRESMGEW